MSNIKQQQLLQCGVQQEELLLICDFSMEALNLTQISGSSVLSMMDGVTGANTGARIGTKYGGPIYH